MSIINKTAVLNPLLPIMDNIVDYIPRATTSKFGMVAIGSGINVDHLGRIYLDTQEYSDRLAAIEAQAASNLATQKSEVAAAIAQVNLTQSQTITALTLEVSNLKTNLTDSITATQTDLINRADQLAQDVTDITQQLTQDKAAFTQEIQDALVYLKDDASVASALRTPRKIQTVPFDGTQDINLPIFTSEIDGLVPKRVGTTTTKYLREDGTWEVPTNTAYELLTQAEAEAGTATTANTISAKVLKDAILHHTPTVTDIAGNSGTASKLQTPRTISLTGGVTGSVSFDGSANASIATTVTGLGVANGIATLDASGKVPSNQLPSYVDDVLEYLNVAAFPPTGETGKIYVESTGNTTYRWSGSAYVKITSGEVASVAGKTGVVILTKTDVGLSNVDNTSDTEKPISVATQQALNGKVDKTTVIDISKGGTGATTIAAAKANLGLEKFAQNPGLNTVVAAPSVDAAIIISDTGWGAYKGNAPGFSRALSIIDGGTGAETAEQARVNLGLDRFYQQGGEYTFMMSPNKDLLINLHNGGLSLWRNSNSTSYPIRTGLNTMVDGNGFIKSASPIVKLFADKIELNDEAEQQSIEYEKLGVGDYLIKNSSGLSNDGWYIEQPKDSNGNIFHAVEYGTHVNGDIWLKTYEQMMDGTRIVADHSKPIDIKENRFVSVRLNELPTDISAPINPTIKDNEGNPAPSRLHELEEGVWVISDENAAILEQERLAAMKPLKRRQFRLTLAMNGYDLNEIESLINQIEDPMQRTIAQIEWQDATDFERTNPTLLMMAQMLGLTSEQLDSLWEYGLAL